MRRREAGGKQGARGGGGGKAAAKAARAAEKGQPSHPRLLATLKGFAEGVTSAAFDGRWCTPSSWW